MEAAPSCLSGNVQMWGRDSIATGQVLSDGISWAVGPCYGWTCQHLLGGRPAKSLRYEGNLYFLDLSGLDFDCAPPGTESSCSQFKRIRAAG